MTYAYNGQHNSVEPTEAKTERGPPASDPVLTAPATIDRWSRDGSARVATGTPAAAASTTFDASASLAQVARATATTWEPTHVTRADLAASDRDGVAANAAKTPIGIAEGLGESALTPGRLQHGTKNLTRAGVLPSWSGTNSPGIIKRAFVPILEHPTATFDHALGGTSVRGFLGDINGQQVAVFVYKEGPYQGQLASSFVPSANQLKMWGVP